jgi:hypothetical protein
MAISLRACGSWAAVNATTQTVTLPTHQAGDMLIVRAACKPYTASITCSTTGWNPVGDGYANGSTANGNGLGSLMHRAFYKIAESSSETDPVIDWGTTAAPGGAVALSYQKGTGEGWATPTGAGGGDSTARTSQTCTISSHISVTAGDMVDFFLAWCDNYASTSPTITQTGVTYNTVSEQPAAALSSSTSNDMAADGGYRLASSGTSSAAAVVTATFGNSEQGGAWQTRLRVAPATTAPAELASFSATAFGATNSITATAGLASATLSIPTGGGTTYSEQVLALSPAGYWRLGETSGTTAEDATTNNNDLTYVDSPVLGEAGALAGDSDTGVKLVAALDSATYSGTAVTLTAPYSIEYWAKGSAKSYGRVKVNSSAQPLFGPFWGTNCEPINYLQSSNYAYFSSTTHADGNWHHFVHVVTGDAAGDIVNSKIYLDGTSLTRGTTVQTNAPLVPNGSIEIDHLTTGLADIWFDELAVYDFELSESQVQANYNLGYNGPASGGGVIVAPNAPLASATVTAFEPPFAASTVAPAGLATVTVEAYGASTAETANAGLASATISAPVATAGVSPSVSTPAVTVSAYGVTDTVQATAGLASAAITANPALLRRAPADQVSASVSAFQPTPTVKPSVQTPAATVSALAPSVHVVAQAGLATVSVTAFGAGATVRPTVPLSSVAVASFGTSDTVKATAGLASASATAFGATDTVTAQAGLASFEVSAQEATAQTAVFTVAEAGLATVTVEAYGAAPAMSAAAPLASASFSAQAVSASAAAPAGLASVNVSAYGSSVAETANAGLASVEVTAQEATAQVAGHTIAHAGLATVTVEAYGATEVVVASAGLASIDVTAVQPSVIVGGHTIAEAGLASVAFVSLDATTTTTTAVAVVEEEVGGRGRRRKGDDDYEDLSIPNARRMLMIVVTITETS